MRDTLRRRRPWLLGTFGVAMAGALLYGVTAVRSSDHQDAPLAVSRPSIDISDVYVFPDPRNKRNVVLAMNVWPLIPAGMSASKSFDPGAMYQIKIGTGEHFTEDYVIQFRPTGVGPQQQIAMYGPVKPTMTGTRSVFVGGPAGSIPLGGSATLPGGITAFAGPREDPFFFDLTQFYAISPDRNFANQPNVPAAIAGCFRKNSVDFLKDFNVLSLVVDLPRAMLADTKTGRIGRINVWATTSLPDNDPNASPSGPQNILADVVRNANSLFGGSPPSATYVQVERLGRPAVKESTESYANHDITNRSALTDDAVLAGSIHSYVEHVAGRSTRIADALTKVLIPDAIEADLSARGPARYLAVETNGKSGLPVAVVRLVPPITIYGVKRALGDPYRMFGGRDLGSPVIDLSLGAIFGSLIPKLGLAPEDKRETPCLTSDNVTPAAKHFTGDFPFIGAPR